MSEFNLVGKILKSEPKPIIPMNIGNFTIYSTPFIAIINTTFEYKREICLKDIAIEACNCGLLLNKNPIHINYWYDGPCGNIGLDYWENNCYEKIKNSVIGISRLNIVKEDKEMIEIAQKAVQQLMANDNIVLLLTMENEKNEVMFYHELFPEAVF